MTKEEAGLLKGGDVIVRPKAGYRFLIIKADVSKDTYVGLHYANLYDSSLEFYKGEISSLHEPWLGLPDDHYREYSSFAKHTCLLYTSPSPRD